MMWRGRKILGDEIMLAVQCRNSSKAPSAPTAAPTMKIYTAAGVLVLSRSIPPIEKNTATGLFGIMQPLNSSFSAGRHYARYTYAISGTDYVDLDAFEILAGGNASGQYISLFHLDRPDGVDFVLGQIDQGGVVVNRGPKIS